MRTNWTNDDRTAFYQWLAKDLGQKFLRYLGEQRPAIGDGLDLQGMAIAAAITKGYDKVLKEINDMARTEEKAVPDVNWVEVEKD